MKPLSQLSNHKRQWEIFNASKVCFKQKSEERDSQGGCELHKEMGIVRQTFIVSHTSNRADMKKLLRAERKKAIACGVNDDVRLSWHDQETTSY